jgi:hypothetical protein
LKVKGHTSNYRTKNIPVKHGMLINQTKELQATDYHLFSSDEELEKASSWAFPQIQLATQETFD